MLIYQGFVPGPQASIHGLSALGFIMYPDWPQSAADLVPLPLCDGPKLKPFDFQGPQRIEFLEHIGQGLHAHVFKVRILGCVYALKLVSNQPPFIACGCHGRAQGRGN